MSSPKSRTSLRILRKTLSPSKRDLTQKIQPGQTSRTETFLTILSESFLAINNNVCPFEDQIRALRLTVKHLHSGEKRDYRAVQFLVWICLKGLSIRSSILTESYFKCGPKVHIQIIWKWIKIAICHMIVELQFWSTCRLSECAFNPNSKWDSGPKMSLRRKLNTWYCSLSDTFMNQKWDPV